MHGVELYRCDKECRKGYWSWKQEEIITKI